MSGASSIEWTDATWSPVVGCTRVSAGCDHCYAARQTKRLAAMGKEKYAGLVNEGKDHFNGVARLHAPALDWPLRWRGAKAAKAEGRPSRIFVNPMSDLFHERLSDEDIAAVFGVMAACPEHVFQVLTKRPERMRRWFGWVAKDLRDDPAMLLDDGISSMHLSLEELAGFYARSRGARWPLPNVWLGVSVENQPTADERIPLLLQTPAAVRFVSYEPALGAVDFRRLLYDHVTRIDALAGLHGWPEPHADGPRLDWIIVGGESGHGARPFDIAWARSAVTQCRAAGVACFVKQLGARPFNRETEYVDGIAVATSTIDLDLRDRKGGDWSEWPEDLRVREFPITPKEP